MPIRKYTGQDAEVFALLCEKSNELEKQGLNGAKLFKKLCLYYSEAKERINTGVVAHVQEKEYDSGWFD